MSYLMNACFQFVQAYTQQMKVDKHHFYCLFAARRRILK